MNELSIVDKNNSLTAEAPLSNGDIIKNLILTHDRGKMLEAKSYYENKGENNFLKKLIRQKVNYLLANPVTPNVKTDIDWDDFIREAGKKASIEGVTWLHPYIDARNEFKVRVIDGHEIIPIYDTQFNEDIVEIIRYYSVEVVHNDRRTLRYRVELWDAEKVTYYQEDEGGNYCLDLTMINPVYHFNRSYNVLSSVFKVDKTGWGAPPFVPLYNNDEKSSDFEDIAKLVKAYDSSMQGFIGNIDALADALLLIKDKNYTQYVELMENIKKHRVLPVDEMGDAKYLTLDIPVEARESIMSMLKDNIYEFGMGVDTRKLSEGGNITNVTIKARYADLDLKANEFSIEIQKAANKLTEFYNAFRSRTKIIAFKKKNIELTFNKTLIVNEVENFDNLVKMKGLISDATWLEHNPWVTDVKKEMAQIDSDIRQLNQE